MTTESFRQLSNPDLLEATARVAADERRSTVDLVELLSEVDARRLYLGLGCASLFTYCTEILRLSESAAYHRIEAARAMRVFPLIGERLRDASLTLTTVALLRPHLTIKNHVRLLDHARNKSKREVEQQIACLVPKPDVESLVRRMPSVQSAMPDRPREASGGAALLPALSEPPVITASTPAIPAPRAKIQPLSSDRYLLRVTLSAEAHANLRRAQGLMAHTVPNGDPAAVIDQALALLVTHLERQKSAVTSRPRQSAARQSGRADSRYVPAEVRRHVWLRDGGQCVFLGPQGRCTETRRLEFHHVVPFARGGPATADNIALRCRAHNSYESEQCFGRWNGEARDRASRNRAPGQTG
jgi:5-methylcytosine-specific restriction endonuclease McrA